MPHDLAPHVDAPQAPAVHQARCLARRWASTLDLLNHNA